nr:X-linked retinitis pigmentosa GTPase regulator-interacting protein 1-like isoform X1 [Penaeus vannamei]
MPSFFTVLCGTMEPGQWTLRVFQDGVQDARHYELPLVVLPSSADLPSDPDLLQSIDLLQGLWTVEKVTLLPLSDYYGDSPKLPSRDSKRPTLSPREEDKAKKQENEEEKREEEKLEKQKRDKDEEAEKKKKEEEEEEEKKKTEKEEGEIKEETRAHVKDVHLPPRSRRSAEDELHFGFHHDDPVFSVREWVLCSGGLLTTSLTLVFTYHWLLLPALYGVRPSPRMRRSALLVLMAILMQIVVCALYCR